MRRLAVAFALVAFVAAGAAQPADAGPGAASSGNDTVEVNDTGDNETNGTEGPPEDAPGKSAQFDARLMTAINTVDALTEIAPNEDAEQRLENALSILRGVQEDTDTKSLGPENRTRDRDMDRDQDRDQEADEEESDSPEDETGDEEEPGEDEEADERGPPENDNRPGFVQNMLRGLFG